MTDRDPRTIGVVVCSEETCGGAPRIAGTRITVEAITSLYRDGLSCGEILDRYRHIDQEDIDAALRYELRHQRRLIRADAIQRLREALDDLEDLGDE